MRIAVAGKPIWSQQKKGLSVRTKGNQSFAIGNCFPKNDVSQLECNV